MFKAFFKFAALLLLAVISLQGCKSQYDLLLNSNDVEEKYNAAFDYFNNGKFSKAARLFESMAVQTSGTSKDDTVQFYWGLSNYRFKDYYTEEAAFLRIDCLYRSTYRSELDQKPTYTALGIISQYMVENPNSSHFATCSRMVKELNDRLDKKAYDNARLYYKMELYKSARTAFKNILKDDADNIYREDILYYTAKSSYKYAQLSVEAKQKERYRILLTGRSWRSFSSVRRRLWEGIRVRRKTLKRRKRNSKGTERNY